MAHTSTNNYLGKCKEDGCDYVIFATAEDVQHADNWNGVVAGTGVYQVGNYGRFARCTNRHKVFPCKLVKGTYSKDHQCDARCLNAKGHTCTCSCGGANHGRGHVATVTDASTLPERAILDGKTDLEVAMIGAGVTLPSGPGLLDMVAQAVVRENPELVKPLRHLGEVGKHITGEVTVDALGEAFNKTLYTLKATNGGHVITWIAPEYADPQWPIGKTFTLRAKVKAHKFYKNVPETQVTYAEEVV